MRVVVLPFDDALPCFDISVTPQVEAQDRQVPIAVPVSIKTYEPEKKKLWGPGEKSK